MFVRKASIQPIEFDGLSIFDYTADSALSASIAFIEVPSGARHAQAWSRRSDKYYLVTNGKVSFEIGAERQTLSTGDFCHVRQGETFSYANQSPGPASLILAQTPSFDLTAEVFVK